MDRIDIVIGIMPPTLRQPMLAPTWVPYPDQIDWPVLASEKINGLRGQLFPGFGARSRTGCTWRSEHLPAQLAAVQAVADRHNLVLDGELWAPGLTAEQIQQILSRRDGRVDGLQYLLFDAVDYGEYEGESVTPFADRYRRALHLLFCVSAAAVLDQQLIRTWSELCDLYRQVRSTGGEGLMIRRPDSLYHHGRCTMDSRNIFKIKPIHPNSHQTEIPSGLEV